MFPTASVENADLFFLVKKTIPRHLSAEDGIFLYHLVDIEDKCLGFDKTSQSIPKPQRLRDRFVERKRWA